MKKFLIAGLIVGVVGFALSDSNRPTRNQSHLVIDSIVAAKPLRQNATGIASCQNSQPTNAADGVFNGWKRRAATVYANYSTYPKGYSNVTRDLQYAHDYFRKLDSSIPKFTVNRGGTTVTKPTENGKSEIMFGPLSGSTLGTTYNWYKNGRTESDIIFNSKVKWANLGATADGCYEAKPYFDLKNVAAHEIGHSLGLGHSSGRFETMYATAYTGETLKRSIGRGDKAALLAHY